MPELGYAKRIHLMNHMIPGLTGDKMSSSEAHSKIDVLDSAEQVRTKIAHSLCDVNNLENNGVLAFTKYVILPLFGSFKVCSGNECKQYYEYADLEKDFIEQRLSADHLKNNVAEALNGLMIPIRKWFEDPKLRELVESAYPTAN